MIEFKPFDDDEWAVMVSPSGVNSMLVMIAVGRKYSTLKIDNKTLYFKKHSVVIKHDNEHYGYDMDDLKRQDIIG